MSMHREYRLTPTQEGMLYHALLKAETEAYQVQLAFHFPHLDPLAFTAAWDQIARRHRVFRTRFAWKERERPTQIVDSDVALSWQHLDWRDKSPEESLQQWQALLRVDRATPFDPAVAPLSRLTLMREADKSFRFAWTFSHLLLDGWSLSIVLNELRTLYAAQQTGRAVTLPDPPPLDEYFQWFDEQDVEQAAEIWRRKFHGFETPTLLHHAAGRHSLPQSVERYDHRTCELSPAETASLASLCKQHHVTVNSAVLACWASLLGRYCASDDVVFGTVVSGRPPHVHDVERMVGLFINTLPLRVRLAADQPFWKAVAEIQSWQLELRELESTSLSDVQRWSGLPSGVPMFDTLVVFENHPANPASLPDSNELEIDEVAFSDPAHYPLSFVVAQDTQLTMRATYRRGSFAEQTVETLLVELAGLLRMVASGEDPMIDRRQPPLRSGEHDTSMRPSGTAEVLPPPDVTSTLHEMFDACVADGRQNTVAVIDESGETSFGKLRENSDRLAKRLRDAGIGMESPVGLMLPRSLDSVVGMLAILKAGGTFVPLDPRFPAEHLKFIVNDAQLSVVVTRSELRSRLPATLSCEAICLDDPATTTNDADAKKRNPSRCGAEAAAYIFYTSGSSGQPKGVVGTHGGLIQRMRWMWNAYPLVEGERSAHKTSLNFVDCLWEVFGPLLQGTPIVVISDEVLLDVPQLMTTFARHNITRLVVVPSLFARFSTPPRTPIHVCRQVSFGRVAVKR